MCDERWSDIVAGRGGGQFTKYRTGGGAGPKSCMHCHFSAREGFLDEFGIGFHNPAVLDISPPFLVMGPPHAKELQVDERYSIVWVQYCLLDAEQIEPADDPVELGWLEEPSTPGKWGHYRAGGERLKYQEREREREREREVYQRQGYGNQLLP